jgi:hypothetical protein
VTGSGGGRSPLEELQRKKANRVSAAKRLFVRRHCVPTHDPDCPKEVLPEAGGVCTCGFEQPAEAVDHPAHYNMGDIEVIDVIEDWRLGFHEGNAVKYIGRAKFKGKELEDLEKASWYLQRLIDRVRRATTRDGRPVASVSWRGDSDE